jgi:fucose permease
MGQKSSNWLLHAGFVLTGVVTTLLGPILVELARQNHFRDIDSGKLFTAQFTGSMLGLLLCTLLSSGRSRQMLVLGFATMGAGVALVSQAHGPTLLAALFLNGIGISIVTPLINLLIASAGAAHRFAALNLLNFAWSAGALSWPLMVGAACERNLGVLLVTIAALLCVLALWFVFSRFQAPAATLPEHTEETGNNGIPVSLIAAAFFIYVGVETASAGWLTSLTDRMSASLSFVPNALFWTALLAGRLACGTLLRALPSRQIANWASLVMCVGLALLTMTASAKIVPVAAILVGAGLAPLFPGYIAALARSTLKPAYRPAVFVFAAAGGALVPLLIGSASTALHDLRSALIILLALGIALTMIQMRMRVEHASQQSASAAAGNVGRV